MATKQTDTSTETFPGVPLHCKSR